LLFETRYFWARLAPSSPEQLQKLKELIRKPGRKFVSSITIYEIFKLTIEKEGKDVAELRVRVIESEFEIIQVSAEIAKEGAKIAAKLKIPMADSLIMATAKELSVPCVTDDPHYSEIRKVWV
jgi:toxin FitB